MEGQRESGVTSRQHGLLLDHESVFGHEDLNSLVQFVQELHVEWAHRSETASHVSLPPRALPHLLQMGISKGFVLSQNLLDLHHVIIIDR